MASFPKMTTTSAGQRLLTKAMAGAALQFTKIVLGDGQLNGVSISTLTALISQKAYCDITFEKSTGTTYQVGGLLLPENITTGFYWREVGLIALDPDDSSEVLFSYSNDGTATDYIDPNVTDSRFEKNIYISTGISTASSVTVEIPSTDTYAMADLSNVNLNEAMENQGIAFIPLAQKGVASGVAELDSSGKVPSAQLPSYVDDVLEYSNLTALPASGETGKIYVAQDTNKTYRWSGSAYVEISQSLALGETSATAYRGDRGKTAYDHSQNTGNPHGATAADVGAATKPSIVTVTFATASWTLNATTGCYEQTVACAGLLAADSYNIDVSPVGSTDAAAQALTDAAYAVMAGPGGRMSCDTDGYLYARCPAGAAAPVTNFQVAVVISR